MQNISPELSNLLLTAAHGLEPEAVEIIDALQESLTEGTSGAAIQRWDLCLKLQGGGSRYIQVVSKNETPHPHPMFFNAGVREREFYQHLASQLPVKTLRMLAAGRIDGAETIILESLPPGRGKHLLEWTTENVRGAIYDLASIHAALWDSASLNRYANLSRPLTHDWQLWLGEASRALANLHALKRSFLNLPLEINLDLLISAREVLLKAPQTLIHGDFGGRNIWLALDGERYIYDWQTAAVGCGLAELAYFCVESTDIISNLELPLDLILHWYLTALKDFGGPSLAFEEVERTTLAGITFRFFTKIISQAVDVAAAAGMDGDDEVARWELYFDVWRVAMSMAHHKIFWPMPVSQLAERLDLPDLQYLTPQICFLHSNNLDDRHAALFSDCQGRGIAVCELYINTSNQNSLECTALELLRKGVHHCHVLSQETDLIYVRDLCEMTGITFSAAYEVVEDMGSLFRRITNESLPDVVISSSSVLEQCGLVSVIIPTYNRASYLPDAVSSVIEQRYKRVEIIVVDDGSDDTTFEVLKPFSEHIIYIRQENAGKSEAVNAGLRVSSGDYIWVLDDDDIALPHKLQYQIRFMQHMPDVSFTHTGWVDVGTNNNGQLQSKGFFYAISPSPNKQLKTMFEQSFVASPTVVARKAMYETVGGYEPSLFRAQQYHMWLRVLTVATSRAFVAPTILFRLHDGERGPASERFAVEQRASKREKYEKQALKIYHQQIDLNNLSRVRTTHETNLVGYYALALAKRALWEEVAGVLELWGATFDGLSRSDAHVLEELKAWTIIAEKHLLLQQIQKLEDKMRDGNCLLCEFSRNIHAHNQEALYRDETVLVTPYNKKLVPGFTVVMPLRCVEHVEELAEEEADHFFRIAAKFSKLIKDELHPERVYWTIFRESANHLHLWLLPRYSEMLTWGMSPDKIDHCHAHILLNNLFEGRKTYSPAEVDAASTKLKFAAQGFSRLQV